MSNLLFRNWKIKTKLMVSFFILTLLFFIVLSQAYYTLRDVNDKKIPMLISNEKVNESMLLMRKNEKDFLLRDRQNEAFFENGTSSYIDGFEENYNTLQSSVSILMKSKDIKTNQLLMDKLNQILVEAKVYYDTFLEVVDKTKERGFKDYGLEGALRSAIHGIEDSISMEEHIIFMLQARRSEKDYFLRHDLEYVDKVTSIVGDLKKSLIETNNSDIIKLLDEYYSNFTAVVSIEQEIGLTEEEGLNGIYRNAIHKLEPLIVDIHQNILDLTNSKTDSMISIMVILTYANIVIAIFFAFFISHLITKPIVSANSMMKNIADGEGDLTKQLQVNSKDEVGNLSGWFNRFVIKIREIVSLVQKNSDTIAHSSEELATATEYANESIEIIASEMTKITDGLQNSASVIEEATASIDELADGALVISKEALSAANNSQEVLRAAKYGATKLKDVEKAIDNIELSSGKTYDMIKELKDSSSKIIEIASLITAIAGQTNLLALNANIEAAKAGEHGSGFSVVAHEVKKLAEESKLSADRITQIIRGVENKIEKTYLMMQREKELVDEGIEKVNQTDMEFKNILILIEQTTDKITVISEASRHQSVVAKEMASAMSEISNTTQESASSSKSISLSIEEQVSAFEQIGASIDELSNMANQLQVQTSRFRT